VGLHLFSVCCPDYTTRKRIELRQDDSAEASDGRWELYYRQKNDFEPLVSPHESWEEIDTARPVEENIVRVRRIMEGSEA
jgi:predicted kinase